MMRTIIGFHADDVGDFVAELSCLHGQHVRHSPPFRERSWVTTSAGRAEHVGTDLDCPLCDRAELPDGLTKVRTAGPFDEKSLPEGLRRPHRVADATWGLLQVLRGRVRFTMETEPPIDVMLLAGDVQAIPPAVTHTVHLSDATISVDFLAGRTSTD